MTNHEIVTYLSIKLHNKCTIKVDDFYDNMVQVILSYKGYNVHHLVDRDINDTDDLDYELRQIVSELGRLYFIKDYLCTI